MSNSDNPKKLASSSKRKLNSHLPARKRSKSQHVDNSYSHSLENLPWKSVSRPSQTGIAMDGDDGILDLEEVDNVEVLFEQTDTGRVVKFNVSYLNGFLRLAVVTHNKRFCQINLYPIRKLNSFQNKKEWCKLTKTSLWRHSIVSSFPYYEPHN